MFQRAWVVSELICRVNVRMRQKNKTSPVQVKLCAHQGSPIDPAQPKPDRACPLLRKQGQNRHM